MTNLPVDTVLAEHKVIENVQPGWWVQTWAEDGSDSWARVVARLDMTHNETGRKATFVRAIDLNGEPVELREWNGTPVTAVTAAKAKRAGLEEQ